MIFIGAELSDPHAHFVTNIIACIGTGDDLVIDLLKVNESSEIFDCIAAHLKKYHEDYVIYNAYTDDDFFLSFKKNFPRLKLITVFSDDEWRHSNYDRYLALFSDVFTVAVKENIKCYLSNGLSHVHYMQWACNPEQFHPIGDNDEPYDVTFIGAAYGKRVDYIRYLLRQGIDIKVFGPHWNRYRDIQEHWGGFLSSQDMLKIISRSRINLNFLWTSRDPDRTTIKGRTLELAACRAFQLSNYTDEFGNYGFLPGKNIGVFEDKADLLEKIRYYLDHADERQKIADAAYHFVLKQHTWESEFGKLFSRIEQNDFSPMSVPCFRVLVIAAEDVKHGVAVQDVRMDITLVSDSRSIPDAREYHGVIRLNHDSTINNDTLYMMAFGLIADNATFTLANFYLGRDKYWIHFRDTYIQSCGKRTKMLPEESIMVSGKVWGNHMSILAKGEGSMAFVESPSFSIDLPYFKSRLLRFFFCDHGDTRARIRQCVQERRFPMLVSIITDKLWQNFFMGL